MSASNPWPIVWSQTLKLVGLLLRLEMGSVDALREEGDFWQTKAYFGEMWTIAVGADDY